jgi:hypothetical protein
MNFAAIRRFGAALALGWLSSMAAHAQHLHAGDVEIGALSGFIVVDPEALAEYASNGYALFEGDFRDLSGGAFGTDDPGFISEEGALTAGDIIYFRGVGSLMTWNGANWVGSTASVSLSIEDALGELTVFSGSGITSPQGIIGQVNGAGEIHEHLDFDLLGADRVLASAYLITLQIGSDLNGFSQPFYVVMNAGLGEEAFEGAVSALTTPVPEPSAWAMFGMGLGLLSCATRRRSA